MFDLDRKRSGGQPAGRSLLGLESEAEDAEDSPITRSLLGLGQPRPALPPAEPSASGAVAAPRAAGAPGASGSAAATPPYRPAVPEFATGRRPPPVPELERDLIRVERRAPSAFPVERAILFSLAAHILIFLLLVYMPATSEHDPSRGLLGAFMPKPKVEDSIPIVFRAAPGPERQPRDARDFSDRNRRAGGGDRTKPKSDSPFVPVRPGREGLAPGAGALASSAPPPAGRRGEGKQAQSAPAEKAAAPSAEGLRQPAGSPSSASSSGKLENLDQAIREAAKGVGMPGEGGAGIPNPEGGFVDSGPLSFETSWYDWGPYADEMVRRIKLHWDIPKLAELGWKGKLTIHFNIRLDGSVEGATIVAGSGIPPFDYAALQAILRSNPFKPLPKDLIKEVPGKTKEGITVTFFYNMRIDKTNTSQGGS